MYHVSSPIQSCLIKYNVSEQIHGIFLKRTISHCSNLKIFLTVRMDTDRNRDSFGLQIARICREVNDCNATKSLIGSEFDSAIASSNLVDAENIINKWRKASEDIFLKVVKKEPSEKPLCDIPWHTWDTVRNVSVFHADRSMLKELSNFHKATDSEMLANFVFIIVIWSLIDDRSHCHITLCMKIIGSCSKECQEPMIGWFVKCVLCPLHLIERLVTKKSGRTVLPVLIFRRVLEIAVGMFSCFQGPSSLETIRVRKNSLHLNKIELYHQGEKMSLVEFLCAAYVSSHLFFISQKPPSIPPNGVLQYVALQLNYGLDFVLPQGDMEMYYRRCAHLIVTSFNDVNNKLLDSKNPTATTPPGSPSSIQTIKSTNTSKKLQRSESASWDGNDGDDSFSPDKITCIAPKQESHSTSSGCSPSGDNSLADKRRSCEPSEKDISRGLALVSDCNREIKGTTQETQPLSSKCHSTALRSEKNAADRITPPRPETVSVILNAMEDQESKEIKPKSGSAQKGSSGVSSEENIVPSSKTPSNPASARSHNDKHCESNDHVLAGMTTEKRKDCTNSPTPTYQNKSTQQSPQHKAKICVQSPKFIRSSTHPGKRRRSKTSADNALQTLRSEKNAADPITVPRPETVSVNLNAIEDQESKEIKPKRGSAQKGSSGVSLEENIVPSSKTPSNPASARKHNDKHCESNDHVLAGTTTEKTKDCMNSPTPTHQNKSTQQSPQHKAKIYAQTPKFIRSSTHRGKRRRSQTSADNALQTKKRSTRNTDSKLRMKPQKGQQSPQGKEVTTAMTPTLLPTSAITRPKPFTKKPTITKNLNSLQNLLRCNSTSRELMEHELTGGSVIELLLADIVRKTKCTRQVALNQLIVLSAMLRQFLIHAPEGPWSHSDEIILNAIDVDSFSPLKVVMILQPVLKNKGFLLECFKNPVEVKYSPMDKQEWERRSNFGPPGM